MTTRAMPAEAFLQLVVEELLCRGVLLNVILRKTDSAWKAVAGSALFFAVLHGQMLMVPWYFAWGCAVGWAYVRTRSLWTPLIIHAYYNLSSVLWSFLLRAVSRAL